MKLLSIFMARSIWLANSSDFNPKGRKLTPILIPFVVDLYKFKKYPSTQDILDETKGIIFQAGEFKNKEGDLIGVNLTLFNFGIVAETQSSTSDSDFFLHTLLTQLHENFNLSHYENIIRARHYLSQVYVSTDKFLGLINPKLKEISQYLSENIAGYGEVAYKLGGMSFWADQIHAVQPPPFSIERQAGTPFSEKRYFSSSGLQTEKHLELLDRLEAILSGS
jgi:hypothetical protein